MQTGFNSSLAPIDRSRALLVVGILAATFAVGLATGILLSRVSSGAGQASGVVIAVDVPLTSTKLDSWRLGVPAVPAAPVLPNRMIDSWRLGVPAVPAAPAQPSTKIDAWRLAVR